MASYSSCWRPPPALATSAEWPVLQIWPPMLSGQSPSLVWQVRPAVKPPPVSRSRHSESPSKVQDEAEVHVRIVPPVEVFRDCDDPSVGHPRNVWFKQASSMIQHATSFPTKIKTPLVNTSMGLRLYLSLLSATTFFHVCVGIYAV